MAKGNPTTEADTRFEAYLDDHEIAFEYEPDWRARFDVGGASNPDFLVDPAGTSAVCEVKRFTTRRITEHLIAAGGTAWLPDKMVFGPVRSAMTDAAQKQLLDFAALDLPLVVVLANPLGADVSLDSEHVTNAMLGNPKFRIAVGPGAPPDDPGQSFAEDYGAFVSVLPGGGLRNHNPHVSAVVVVHERDYRSSEIERRLSGEPDVEDFGSTGAAMAHYLDAARRWEANDDLPEGSYRWVEVFDLSGNPTPPGFTGRAMPRSLFGGPRDRWYGFVGDRFGELKDGSTGEFAAP